MTFLRILPGHRGLFQSVIRRLVVRCHEVLKPEYLQFKSGIGMKLGKCLGSSQPKHVSNLIAIG